MKNIFMGILVFGTFSISAVSQAYEEPTVKENTHGSCTLMRGYSDVKVAGDFTNIETRIDSRLQIKGEKEEAFKHCLADAANLAMTKTYSGELGKKVNSATIHFKGESFLLIRTSEF